MEPTFINRITAYSIMDGILLQNNGADPITYVLRGIDIGWLGWSLHESPTSPLHGVISFNNRLPTRDSIQLWWTVWTMRTAIGISASYPSVDSFTTGSYSILLVTLLMGYEMRFQFWWTLVVSKVGGLEVARP